MDRERFDALARFLGTAGSRRAMLGGLVAAAVLGNGFAADAGHRHRGRRRHKRKQQHAATVCFGTATCVFTGTGAQDLDACNFSGSPLFAGSNCGGCSLRGADLGGADLNGADLNGASLRDANLHGATLVGADLRGASLRGACLTDADLTDARTDGSSLEGAFLCRTTLPDGQVANDTCATASRCCPVGAAPGCGSDADCGAAAPFCCDTVCTALCCVDAQCPGQAVCDQGVCRIPNPTCAADPNACVDGFVQCGGGGGDGVCYCFVTTEGDSRCLNLNSINTPNCTLLPQCTSSDQCDPGEFCAVLTPTTCCTGQVCGRECPEFVTRDRGNTREVGPPSP